MSKRISVTISNELYSSLSHIAQNNSLSMSQMVSTALNEYVMIYEGKQVSNVLSVHLVAAMESILNKQINDNLLVIKEILKDVNNVSTKKETLYLLKAKKQIEEVKYG